jgi:hypothetical protein
MGFDSEEIAAYGIGIDEAAMPELSSADRPSFQQMTFTLHESQVAAVLEARAVPAALVPIAISARAIRARGDELPAGRLPVLFQLAGSNAATECARSDREVAARHRLISWRAASATK